MLQKQQTVKLWGFQMRQQGAFITKGNFMAYQAEYIWIDGVEPTPTITTELL